MNTRFEINDPQDPATPKETLDFKTAFRRFAHKSAQVMGLPNIFIFALFVVLIWAITGPFFNYSDTWQLVINTGTSVMTFLMVFLIQNTQNRDAQSMQLKLDELVRAMKDARNELIDLENCTDEQLAKFEAEFTNLKLQHEARRATTIPEASELA